MSATETAGLPAQTSLPRTFAFAPELAPEPPAVFAASGPAAGRAAHTPHTPLGHALEDMAETYAQEGAPLVVSPAVFAPEAPVAPARLGPNQVAMFRGGLQGKGGEMGMGSQFMQDMRERRENEAMIARAQQIETVLEQLRRAKQRLQALRAPAS